MRERVIPFDERTATGAGVLFSSHTHSSLLAALQRAVMLYAQPDHYSALRANAHAAACDVADTAWHWQCEIQRLLACQISTEQLQAEQPQEEQLQRGAPPHSPPQPQQPQQRPSPQAVV